VLLDRNAHGCGCPPPPQRSPQGGALAVLVVATILAALAAVSDAAVVRAALASARAGVEVPRPRFPIRITEAPAPPPAASRPASSTAMADVPRGFLVLYQRGARHCPELPWACWRRSGDSRHPLGSSSHLNGGSHDRLRLAQDARTRL
jgi:hypothetical protein